MAENPIIAEIHEHREALARECDFDLEKLIAYYRRLEKERGDDGHPLVTLGEANNACVLREEPPASDK